MSEGHFPASPPTPLPPLPLPTFLVHPPKKRGKKSPRIFRRKTKRTGFDIPATRTLSYPEKNKKIITILQKNKTKQNANMAQSTLRSVDQFKEVEDSNSHPRSTLVIPPTNRIETPINCLARRFRLNRVIAEYPTAPTNT